MAEYAVLLETPLFGVALTVAFYATALRLQRRWRWLHPLFVTAGGMIALLSLTGIPYESYKVGGDLVTFFLGPVTVALAVPLYEAVRKSPGFVKAVAIGVVCGTVTGIALSALVGWLLGGDRALTLSLMPKTVTSPIAIEVARLIGGEPELAAVFAVLTGLLGSMFGPALLHRVGLRGDLAVGTAIGTAAHGIGTARLLRDSPLQGGIGGLAMGIAGLVNPLFFLPVYWWLNYGH